MENDWKPDVGIHHVTFAMQIFVLCLCFLVGVFRLGSSYFGLFGPNSQYLGLFGLNSLYLGLFGLDSTYAVLFGLILTSLGVLEEITKMIKQRNR